MKVIYVAGPFRGKTGWEIEENIREAEKVALEVWKKGYAAICPHTNTRFFHGTLPDEDFLKGCLELLRRSDALLFAPGWERSEGARVEAQEALVLGLPLYFSIDELPEG